MLSAKLLSSEQGKPFVKRRAMAMIGHYEKTVVDHIVTEGGRVKRKTQVSIRKTLMSDYPGSPKSRLQSVIRRGRRLDEMVEVLGVGILGSERVCTSWVDMEKSRIRRILKILQVMKVSERWREEGATAQCVACSV